MKTCQLTAAIWKEREGYVSRCPELGVASCGDTPEDALSNLREAVELYLENARELGLLGEVEEALSAAGKFIASFEVELHEKAARSLVR